MEKKAFDFLKIYELPKKPRKKGITEIRVPYYAATPTMTYIADLLDSWSDYFDGMKFACGTQRLIDSGKVRKIIRLCHEHDVYVSTGGFVERVLVQGKQSVDRYFKECKGLGFDVIEISSGFVNVSIEDRLAMVKKVSDMGMKPKPEVSMMLGAGAGTHIVGYKTRMKSMEEFFSEAKAYIDSGAEIIMVESEGLTEDLPPKKWRLDVIRKLIRKFGHERWMFEAADPEVFKWYYKNVGREANLFIDHTQVVEFNAWRLGLWGDQKIWGNKRYAYR
ncbi:MAG: phosphosulfolactate synthase [Candidatus Micrarchaeota archaeon]|nr:phosphosulfolactate synthase [Candidatus Micrarchaeota archaeon]MDE1864434.1 phosphosulfolactate synthase [Candidatus Micrarchaeota archaeon]